MIKLLEWLALKILNRYKKQKVDIKQEEILRLTKPEMFPLLDLSSTEDPIIYPGNAKDSKNLLILDDLEDAFIMLDFDFKSIKKKTGIDYREHYNIIKCSGNNAGMIAYKYLLNNKIDKAYLDVTLANKLIQIDDTNYLEFDGIDIAIEIHKLYPDAEIAICTSHNLYKNNTQVKRYIDKFEKYTNRDMMKCYINRILNREDGLYNLVSSDKYSFNNVKKVVKNADN